LRATLFGDARLSTRDVETYFEVQGKVSASVGVASVEVGGKYGQSDKPNEDHAVTQPQSEPLAPRSSCKFYVDGENGKLVQLHVAIISRKIGKGDIPIIWKDVPIGSTYTVANDRLAGVHRDMIIQHFRDATEEPPPKKTKLIDTQDV